MFEKAKSGQAKIKIGIYGDAGSGKTPVALLIAEGLNNTFGGKTAFIDTEHGTDFYVEDIPERTWHKKGFDIYAEYTKSVNYALDAVRYVVESDEYTVIVIDTLTHLWENAKASYTGKRYKNGAIPMNAWDGIKKPFKDLIELLMESDKHVILCGRMANMYEESSDDKLVKSGTKMKSEGDTAYEPNILLQMTPTRTNGKTIIQAYVEKDRSSILYGKTIPFPSFENIVKPVLKYLSSDSQAFVKHDVEADRQRNLELDLKSTQLFGNMSGKIAECASISELDSLKSKLSDSKKDMTDFHVTELYSIFSERKEALSKTSKSISSKIKEV